MNWFKRLFKKQKQPIDSLEFAELMFSIPVYKRNSMQAYQDFRHVFLDTDEGRRVLRQILAWSNYDGSSIPPMNMPDRAMWINEGARSIGIKVRNALYIEPNEPPPSQNKG